MSLLQTQMLSFDSVELFVHVSVCKHSLNNASDRMHLIDCRKYLRRINRTIQGVIFSMKQYHKTQHNPKIQRMNYNC